MNIWELRFIVLLYSRIEYKKQLFVSQVDVYLYFLYLTSFAH